MYNKVYDFCKVRNEGNVYKNGDEPTPRLKFLMSLLDSEGIEYKHMALKGNKENCEEMDRTQVAKAIHLIMDRRNHPILISGVINTGRIFNYWRQLL